LLNKVSIKPPEPIARFIVKLNGASVATRYPEEISKLQKDFTQGIVKEILAKGRETLGWIKKQL
jgi:HEPN domain-containing protein